jgi:DNA-binding response OmpR family regulator
MALCPREATATIYTLHGPKRPSGVHRSIAEGKHVVLLAEDDPIVRNFLLLVLQHQAYAVLVAVDGQEAIELSRAFQGEIDLLVTDMEMPRLGGDELGELLMTERRGIRILQISGKLAENIIGRNLSLAFLHKPFLPGAFVAKIGEVFAGPPGTPKVIAEISN